MSKEKNKNKNKNPNPNLKGSDTDVVWPESEEELNAIPEEIKQKMLARQIEQKRIAREKRRRLSAEAGTEGERRRLSTETGTEEVKRFPPVSLNSGRLRSKAFHAPLGAGD